jgi:NAD(P)-dependent dehydrogenase (short-subunit alcohol dehydrogenase family)
MKKIAIITGASSGIGRQIAIDLSQKNFECFLLGRNENKLIETQKSCPNSKTYTLDLSSPESINSVASQILNELKKTESEHIVLINNAGIVERSSFEKTEINSWIRQFQTNLFGPVQLTKNLVSLLGRQKSARIINISSTLGIKPIIDTTAYSATKAAMNSWTMSLALELAPQNILVTAICPGIIETPIQDFYKTEDATLRTTLNSLQPLGRVGQAEDISKMVIFLSDPSNDWITGGIFPIDGGILLG